MDLQTKVLLIAGIVAGLALLAALVLAIRQYRSGKEPIAELRAVVITIGFIILFAVMDILARHTPAAGRLSGLSGMLYATVYAAVLFWIGYRIIEAVLARDETCGAVWFVTMAALASLWGWQTVRKVSEVSPIWFQPISFLFGLVVAVGCIWYARTREIAFD